MSRQIRRNDGVRDPFVLFSQADDPKRNRYWTHLAGRQVERGTGEMGLAEGMSMRTQNVRHLT